MPKQTSFSKHYYSLGLLSHENFTYPSLCKSHKATLLCNRVLAVMWQEGETKLSRPIKVLTCVPKAMYTAHTKCVGEEEKQEYQLQH